MASIHDSPGRTAFGADPAAYDLGRPPYPAELFAWLKDACGLGPDSRCLDIGAGTGHATLPILSLPVGAVRAIEPDRRLAAALEAKALAVGHGRLCVDLRRFEEADLEPASLEFVFSAAAFHWLPRGKSLARAAEALKPGGWLALWWPVFHDPAAPDAFDAATAHLFSGLEQDPKATASRPPFALDVPARLGEMRLAGFEATQHRLFLQDVAFGPEAIVSLYSSLSRVAVAPAETRDRLLAGVAAIARKQFGGEVRRTIRVSAYVGRRPGPGPGQEPERAP